MTLRLCLLSSLVLLLVADSPGPPSASAILRLTPTRSSGRITIDDKVLRSGRVQLQIPVTKIRNPRMMPISISAIAILNNKKSGRISLGSFSIYPADQTGTFHLPLPETVTKAGRGTGRITFEIRLVPGPETLEANSLEIEIGPMRLTAEPLEGRD